MSHDDNDTKIEQLKATTTMKFEDFNEAVPSEEHEATLQMGAEMAERVAEASGGNINGTIDSSVPSKKGHPILKLLIIVVILAIVAGVVLFQKQGKDALLKYTPEQVTSLLTNNEDTLPTSNEDTEVALNNDLDSEIVQAAPDTTKVEKDFNPTEIIEKAVEDNSSEDVNLEMLEQQMKLLEDSNIDNIDDSIEAFNIEAKTVKENAVEEDTKANEVIDNTEEHAEDNTENNTENKTVVVNDTPAEETITDEIALAESIDSTTDTPKEQEIEDEELIIADQATEAVPLPTPEYKLTAIDQKIKKFIELYKIDSDKANTLAALIGQAAKENNLEALLVAAICAAESSFDPNVVSDSGKIGLMQLSAEDEANILTLSKGELSDGNLKDPAYNLKIGLWYIKFLQYYYKGDLKATLAAYEMGQKEYEALRRSGEDLPVSTERFNHNVHNVYKIISGQNPNNADRAFKKSVSTPKEVAPKQEEAVATESKPEVKQQAPAGSAKSNPVLRKIIGYSTTDEATIDNLEKLVIQRSNEKSFDPILVASIIMAESSFKADSISDSGKVGLLQIDPDRAQLMAKETGIAWSGTNELLNPDYNLELGIAYLSYCTVAFPNDFKAAILCFNAGEEVAKDPASAPDYTAGYLKNLKTYFRLWGATLPKGMKF